MTDLGLVWRTDLVVFEDMHRLEPGVSGNHTQARHMFRSNQTKLATQSSLWLYEAWNTVLGDKFRLNRFVHPNLHLKNNAI